METLNILIPSILYLLLLALGIFILIQNPNKAGMRYLAGTMFGGALYIFGNIMYRISYEESIAIFWAKFLFIPGEIATLLLFLLSFEFAKEFKSGIKINRFIKVTFISIDIIILLLLIFTNTLVDFRHPILVNSELLMWDFNTTNLFLLRTIFLSLKTLMPIINFSILYKNHKLANYKHFNKNMLIANIFLFIGANFSCFHLYFRTRFEQLYIIPEFIQELFIIVGISILLWTLLNPKLLFKEIFEIIKDFMSYIGYSFILIIPYITLLIIGNKYINPNSQLLFFILGISGLIIVTHSTHEWILEFIKRSIKNKKLTIPTLLTSDINYALKNLPSPNLLTNSKLLKLNKVSMLSKKNNISKIDALIQVITDTVEYIKPRNNINRRTISRLKYEILRMIAFEGATESQIMWDLGFDTYTRSVEEKLGIEQREPRYKLKDASEYSATSDRSFKRLKKEAIEMLRWKLEESEKES